MLMEIVEVFTDMVNCSLFPEAYEQLTTPRRKKLGEWTAFEDSLADTSGAWLPQIVREIRYACCGCAQWLGVLSGVIRGLYCRGIVFRDERIPIFCLQLE